MNAEAGLGANGTIRLSTVSKSVSSWMNQYTFRAPSCMAGSYQEVSGQGDGWRDVAHYVYLTMPQETPSHRAAPLNFHTGQLPPANLKAGIYHKHEGCWGQVRSL